MKILQMFQQSWHHLYFLSSSAKEYTSNYQQRPLILDPHFLHLIFTRESIFPLALSPLLHYQVLDSKLGITLDQDETQVAQLRNSRYTTQIRRYPPQQEWFWNLTILCIGQLNPNQEETKYMGHIGTKLNISSLHSILRKQMAFITWSNTQAMIQVHIIIVC